MAGLKTFANNELFTAGDVNSYLMNQVVARVADQAERDALIIPELGQTIERLDLNIGERWDGTAWKKTPLHFCGVHMVKAIAQGWATTATKVQWRTDQPDSNMYMDTHGFYNPAQNTRFTVPFTGWYDVSYSMMSTGTIATVTHLYVNNAEQLMGNASALGGVGAGTNPQSSCRLFLNAGDYVELVYRSNATGAGTWSVSACWLDMKYLGEI
jgi:hypothetical protein